LVKSTKTVPYDLERFVVLELVALELVALQLQLDAGGDQARKLALGHTQAFADADHADPTAPAHPPDGLCAHTEPRGHFRQ
jgi:hypothetical protein